MKLCAKCAIARYKGIADFTNEKDHSTHQIATQILNEELEHEQDIEDWIGDLERMKDDFRKLRL
ncbi:MAG TPA: ferritin-like domain-containing protein [Spirochaetota bacterium]|nr:ferritin-like domain-containing protein [Spirochaetota bacterium]